MKKVDISILERLSILINSDVELLDAIDILINTVDKKNMKKLEFIKKNLLKGNKLSKSFRHFNNDYEFISYIKIAEESGNLKLILQLVHSKYSFEDEMKKNLINLMIYPISVFLISIIIFFFIIIFMVPKFVEIYSEFNGNLPLITKIIISTSNFIIYKFYVLIVILIILLFVYRKIIKNFKKNIDKIKIKISILKEYYILNFLNSMKISLKAKISFNESLKLSKSNNIYFDYEIEKISKNLSKGKSISNIFNNSYLFDEEFYSFLKIGEKNGNLEIIFEKLSKIYEDRFRHKVKIILKMLEPISILFISLFIGLLVISLMLPIFKLGENII